MSSGRSSECAMLAVVLTRSRVKALTSEEESKDNSFRKTIGT